MTYIMVDVESDGPVPGLYSMIAFAAVIVNEKILLAEPEWSTFGPVYIKPISERYQPDALKITGFTREQTLLFDEPSKKIIEFGNWVTEIDKPVFISDNNGYDWGFINWYFWYYCGKNPFGFSSQNLNSFYKGLTKNMKSSFKHLRKTKHDHNPLNDTKGNAEAMIQMCKENGIKI